MEVPPWDELDPDEFEDKLTHKIGEGTFGEVFKTEWRRQSVAVKRLKPRVAGDKSFEKELAFLATVRCEFVVQFIGAATLRPPYLLVTQYVDGGSLYDMVREGVVLDLQSAKQIACDVLKGLVYLHHKEIVHRDIKPENILLTRSRGLKALIADLGISRVVSSSTLATSGVGTFAFMAPEVMNEGPYGVKVDIYSFGLCLFEMVFGRNPIRELNAVQVARRIVLENFRPPFPEPVVSPALRILVERCWACNPADRPSAEDALDVLENIDYNQHLEGNNVALLEKLQTGLAAQLRSNTIRTLDLRSNQMEDVGTQALAKALLSNSSLETLVLNDNRIGEAGARALAEVLRYHPSLQALSLASNNIGDVGAQVVVDALRSNSSLRLLNLYGNGIGDVGAQALADYLGSNSVLQKLDVRVNGIGDAGARTLGDALRINSSLRYLDLSNTMVTDVGAQALADVLTCSNSSLQTLLLRWNGIENAGKRALEKVAAQCALRSLEW